MGLPPDFVLVTGRSYNIAQSTGKFNPLALRSSSVTTGAHATKTHRTFRWLPWLPGKVSMTPLTGADILTGPFSGCWVSIFTLNGTRYVGHIGTSMTATDAMIVQAKAAWATVKTMPGFVLHASFKPWEQAPAAWVTKAMRENVTLDVLAAVSSNQVCQLVGISPYLQAGAGEKKIMGTAAAHGIQATMPF